MKNFLVLSLLSFVCSVSQAATNSAADNKACLAAAKASLQEEIQQYGGDESTVEIQSSGDAARLDLLVGTYVDGDLTCGYKIEMRNYSDASCSVKSMVSTGCNF